MKVIVAGGRKDFSRAAIAILAAVVLVVGAVGIGVTLAGGGSQSVSGTADGSDFTVSAALGALGNFGARSTGEALEVWAEGVASRNGLTQYSVMSTELGERYLEVLAGDVIFEASGATVDSWYASEVIEGETETVAKVLFTISDAGESIAAMAEVTLAEQGEYVVIESLTVESPLYEFTGISA